MGSGGAGGKVMSPRVTVPLAQQPSPLPSHHNPSIHECSICAWSERDAKVGLNRLHQTIFSLGCGIKNAF